MTLDPRHLSPTPLVAAPPLPYVSRRALARVSSPLPAPTECNCCGESVRLISNRMIYGREYGKWPYAYQCTGCGAYVGLHPSTDIPLGTLADRPLREARKRSKAMFRQASRALRLHERKQAYCWLASAMGIPPGECHFAWFDQDRCCHAEAVCAEALQKREASDCAHSPTTSPAAPARHLKEAFK